MVPFFAGNLSKIRKHWRYANYFAKSFELKRNPKPVRTVFIVIH